MFRLHIVRHGHHDHPLAIMATLAPICFIKFFAEERYADQLLAGELYLNTLAYFRKIETVEDGRFDTHEAVSMWLQPEDIIMKLNAPGFDEILITGKDLAAPTSVFRTDSDYIHVFCLYTVTLNNFKIVNGRITGKTEELQRDLTIDKRCFEFGQYAVATNPVLFQQQLREALRAQSRPFRSRFVTYYDETTFHGQIPDKDAPFWKQSRFSYQREYRVCVYPVVEVASPITIRIGDISSFSKKLKATEIDTLWSLSAAD
jgi:hypothetical protein